jgi:hypothetical protein
MPRLWNAVYTVIFMLALWLGYTSMAPDKLRQLHPSIASGCVFTFALASLGGFIALRYARSKGAHFRLPSWSRRFPFFYWEDPLQAFFGYSLFAGGLFVGSLFRLPGSHRNGPWMITWHACLFVGLILAQIIGYALYRDVTQKV